jgi:hypothetical protein
MQSKDRQIEELK